MCYDKYKALYFWQFFSFAASAVSASLVRRSKRNLNAFYSHGQSREVSWKLCFRDYVFVFTGCLLRFLEKGGTYEQKTKETEPEEARREKEAVSRSQPELQIFAFYYGVQQQEGAAGTL